ncbi:hypothetical protein ABT124_45815 [Streptomyces sp. NPDC001982]|uniref:hypothetical protein n=1 Tax=unclassified Streptomyces TaxID=2593676 RepID=UPI00331E214D
MKFFVMRDPSLPFPEPEEPAFTGEGQGSGAALDDVFGHIDIRLDTDQGSVTVEGEILPQVRLVRQEGAKPNPHTPIGTRDGARLTLRVDGCPARIAPARGWLPRRSYRVDVDAPGAHYRLVPCSTTASRLLKDKRRIAEFTSCGDGSVTAAWRTPHMGLVAQDAAIGYGLATAFGTGGKSATELLFDLVIGPLLPWLVP